jgi:phosphoglycolate phosphatase-like HAD superfamily hydrolase
LFEDVTEVLAHLGGDVGVDGVARLPPLGEAVVQLNAGPGTRRAARRAGIKAGGRTIVPIRAVWFDVGETLIDETREYGTWADRLEVPRHTFSAMFGAVIARGGDYREVFQHFRPGFDLEAERQARLDAGIGEYLNGHDLYPDVRSSLQALKDAGYFVGVAGNQTARAGRFLRELNLPCDVLATSDQLGANKPDAAFFDKLVAVSGHDRDEIAYVMRDAFAPSSAYGRKPSLPPSPYVFPADRVKIGARGE